MMTTLITGNDNDDYDDEDDDEDNDDDDGERNVDDLALIICTNVRRAGRDERNY